MQVLHPSVRPDQAGNRAPEADEEAENLPMAFVRCPRRLSCLADPAVVGLRPGFCRCRDRQHHGVHRRSSPAEALPGSLILKFSLSEDTYAQGSIELLMHSGIQFGKHNNEGIDPYEFAQLIMTSGMVLSDEITWLAFHSCYDFAYMLKLLAGDNLPTCEVDFFELLQISLAAIHDLKCLMKDCRNLRGGLQGLAEELQVERVGP
ncbi:hypothetical protein HPB49_001753 [Dermacentor silvarum]|uniref:Uncharacterized protein n=1 Tax=Dermacentor silvarum TaxID=543639 RepID=A0ACB8CUN4_DERSI|nr:hypothetical protein HPB49_001753 [Dermacentor silvarum]